MNANEQHGSRFRLIVILVAVLLVVAGAAVLVIGVNAQDHPPQPDAAAAATSMSSATSTATSSAPSTPSTATGTSPAAPKSPAVKGPILARSAPTHLDIPSIGVSSDLLRLGINPDKTVQVPPLSADSQAGWYRYSPTPGQLGPSVILGHVDSAEYGPGVFFKLGALKPGSVITVTRADDTVAVFRVDRTVSYPKNSFPTLEVYGNTDHAALRLITCGGKFDFSSRNYLDNIVTYATLISSHKA